MRFLTLALWFCIAPAAQATVTGFMLNPTTNSEKFATAVAENEGLVTTLTFETHPLGPLDPTFYPGVNIQVSPAVSVRDTPVGAGSNAGPVSPGEGSYETSRYIYIPGGGHTMSITFEEPVLAVGFQTVDYFNPGGVNTTFLNAYSGPSGTGTKLGSFVTDGYNFQTGNVYFVGVLSTASDIRSITFPSPGRDNDGIFIDNIEYARVVPEPGTSLLVMGGLLGLALTRRDRHARA